jgi:hypothetical protein
MGTSKHIIILLTLALGGILMAGQDKPVASALASQHGISNSRVASCIVRISVDPAIMPLSQENIESLLESSGVAYKAGHEVLGFNKEEDFQARGRWVFVEWLNAAPAPIPPGTRSSRQTGMGGPDEEMRRQMEQVYGRDYAEQVLGSSGEGKKDGAQEARPGESPQREGASDPGRQNRSDDDQMRKGSAGMYGTAAGGAVGGMGGMGMGGGAFSAREPSMNTSRLPGETDVAYRTRLLQAREQQKARRSMGNRGMGMGGGMMGGMGGYGGMMGGVGGMGGYGAMMGSTGMMTGMDGMMGGMGGMGFYPVPGAAQQGAGVEQSATVKLTVEVPDGDLPPRADEFLRAVVRNLQDSLSQAYEAYSTDLQRWLSNARAQRRMMEAALEDATGESSAAAQEVKQQLNMLVDVSALNRQVPLENAIDILRKSVDPPLNIVVLWKDVETNLFVQPSSPTNFEGSPRTKLGTALDLLVKGLYDGSAKPMWKIKDDTIVIGTAATLGQAQEAAGQSQVEADVVNLAGERSELARRMQALELDLAGLDARRAAIGVQINVIREQVAKRLSEDLVMQELEKLVQVHLRATSTPEGRIVTPNSSEGQENMIRARIQVANRREELSKQAGGGQLEEFTKELSRMAIDKAEKEAQLQIVRRQLDEVQKQLAQALAFSPEAARLRLAQESLDITGRRVTELQARMANLQPPLVTMIGAN